MKFAINRKTIKSMLNFAAKKDIRYYLQGVCVTQNARGTYIEATDGHILGRLLIDNTPMPENQITMPSDALIKLKGTKKEGEEVLHFTVDGSTVEVISNDGTSKFLAVDARFPDTDRVIPTNYTKEEEKTSQLNPDLLIRFVDFSYDLLGKRQCPELFQRGSSSIIVSFGVIPEFVGVLMPLRNDTSATIPQYCYKSKTVETTKEVEIV